MRILITGAAGNLGTFLARSLLGSEHRLRLMFHRNPLAPDLAVHPQVEPVQADLGQPATLAASVDGVDAIVHFAGVLFQPFPERFLPTTNAEYVRHLAGAAVTADVRRFILISFPHVEGETSPENPARGALDAAPVSVHARTRLLAEHHVLRAAQRSAMEPVLLRSGLIYGRGLLMIEAARWLMRRRLLGVWRRPTWVHPFALPDFLACTRAAIEAASLAGVVPAADDAPMTLQDFLDALARAWGFARPWRAPAPMFYTAALACELWGAAWGIAAPLTRDFIRIGMASHVCDTSRMKTKLLPSLMYPTLEDGLGLL
jgi:nucleoside-diphosphate-sugar epimerase